MKSQLGLSQAGFEMRFVDERLENPKFLHESRVVMEPLHATHY
jgi:hypothetical protein